MRTHTLALTLTAALCAGLLQGCGKVAEKASEAAIEKAIEKEAAKDGTTAKVDLKSGGATVTTTDGQGQTTKMELGGAKVSEAELGVAIYPGAKMKEGTGNRMASPQGQVAMAEFASADAQDKVAAFYREQLKARSAGKQFMDMSTGEGETMFMLGDDKGGQSLQIQVKKADSGSTIFITSALEKKAP